MRVSEGRYTKDWRRLALAAHLIRRQVKTETIRAWTGLSDERVRNLCHTTLPAGESSMKARKRGPTPEQQGVFLRSPGMRNEASSIAVLCRLAGVLPPKPIQNARKNLPSLACGERICRAYELYLAIHPETKFSLERVIQLVIGLAQGDEIEVGNCVPCDGNILIDPLGAARRVCAYCRREARKIEWVAETPEDSTLGGDPDAGQGYQPSLF